ncbi:alpha/beta hydrolase family protein [Rubellicoccus peritrichatus]|uniref:Alpha/beta hydrolase family protein n=1 Tax=Rubellicoccus peritrichatus TaxID=3080537 RepID=A0AAQ3L897_9BACT|nr:alpha/beta hydrolase family protein [Puniceicoccus sp. CR14]WOO40926.1 alpha/beta hydrolase family protein [Puniceicoccus sp. CR14]
MSKSPSKSKKDLQPATELWSMYHPDQAQYSFNATDAASARKWQTKTRQALAKQIALDTIPLVAPQPQVIEEVDKKDYIRQKIVIRTGPHSLMPVYILLPKDRPGPLPVVLAFHGHGYGVKDIVGLWEDGKERDTPDGYHKDFAVDLCRAGFAVAAPEISCFGERQTDFSYLNEVPGQPAPTTCTHSSMLAFHLGLSVVGIRVHDGLRLVDYLETRKDMDINRLGAMGISGGGMHTFFSTCLDNRIKACVVSGYYSTFQDSILGMSHCACNFVPGLAKFGEMYDLVGLIAPRPMLIEAGTYDPIFPIRSVRSSVKKARSVYKVFNASNQIVTDYFEGRHQISGRKSYDFLKQELV